MSIALEKYRSVTRGDLNGPSSARIGNGVPGVARKSDGQSVTDAAAHFLDVMQVLRARGEHGHAACFKSVSVSAYLRDR